MEPSIASKTMIISSDYPMDEIILLKSGSFSLPNNTIGLTVAVPHRLGFTPLCGGNWALTSSFSLQYEYSVGPFPSVAPGFAFSQVVNVFADGTNVYLSADNPTGSTVTVYYRIYGFEPSTSAADVASVVSLGDNYVLNSEYNNPKLYLNSYVDAPATTGSEGTVYADHNLGYIPQAMGWATYSTWNGSAMVSAIHPVGSSHSNSLGVLLVIGTLRAAFVSPPFTAASRCYYRIYLDE